MKHLMRAVLIMFCVTLTLHAQNDEPPISVLSKHLGEAQTLGATVLMQQFRIAPDQRDALLDLPDDGLLIMQLRAGELTTIIQDERRIREEGEWWTVERVSMMRLVTEDDAVIVDTIFIIR